MSTAQEKVTEDYIKEVLVEERVETPQWREIRPAYMKTGRW